MQAKARTIEFEELTAQPYVEVVREIVSVYRGGVEAAMPSAVPLNRCLRTSPRLQPTVMRQSSIVGSERRAARVLGRNGAAPALKFRAPSFESPTGPLMGNAPHRPQPAAA